MEAGVGGFLEWSFCSADWCQFLFFDIKTSACGLQGDLGTRCGSLHRGRALFNLVFLFEPRVVGRGCGGFGDGA